MKTCSHLSGIKKVKPQSDGCAECLEAGDDWLHLRICMECGHVGCCNDSKNKHATKHFHASAHPIIFSFEPFETWGWCFVDEVMFDSGISMRNLFRPGADYAAL